MNPIRPARKWWRLIYDTFFVAILRVERAADLGWILMDRPKNDIATAKPPVAFDADESLVPLAEIIEKGLVVVLGALRGTLSMVEAENATESQMSATSLAPWAVVRPKLKGLIESFEQQICELQDLRWMILVNDGTLEPHGKRRFSNASELFATL